MNYLTLTTIILFMASDAWRDATLKESWWKRHIPKWVNIGIPLVYMLYIAKFNFCTLLILGVACWCVWQLIVNVIYKKGWTSIWIRFLKWIFKIDSTKNK